MAVVMVIVRSTLVVTLALCALLAVPCAAETTEPAQALAKGSRALQFGVGNDFKLGPFQGATIAYERFLRDRLSLRVGAGISTVYSKGPFTDEIENVVSGKGQIDLEAWVHDYSLSCHLVSYRGGRVALYYGGGPKVTYSSRLDEYYDFRISGSSTKTRYHTRSWGAGLEGVAGVQWILNDRFRLQGQYATTVMYGRSLDERSYSSVDGGISSAKETDDRYFVRVAPQAVQLGLAVSF